jgi:DNA topoisomerase VI subunit B
MSAALLTREVFTTSRELEYFSEAELVTQTGYEREEWWPRVLVKELVDNGLDACEQSGAAPEISVALAGDTLTVTDNGPGIPDDVVDRILDFSSRTSDKAAYVSPTRGAQGNALKTVLAIPYVLNDGEPATVQIEALGQRHSITVSTDHVARRPQIEHRREEIVKIGGTAVQLQVDSASKNAPDADLESLQKLVSNYALFNPHATFTLVEDGIERRFLATTPEWQKWGPSDPTSAHWYSVEQFEDLVASYVAAERAGARRRTVREFVTEFRGLAGTSKQKQVVTAARLERAYLSDLVGEQCRLDRSSLERLLNEMRQASSPVKPELLGVLGESHFRSRLQGAHADQSFRYKSLKGIDASGKPYVVECAFVLTEDPLLQGVHVGLNWSVPLSNPIQESIFTLSNGAVLYGLPALLEHFRINLSRDPICIALHLVYPRFHFLDRGKGSVVLDFDDEVAKAVSDVTKEWAAIKKQQERDQKQAARLQQRLRTGRSSRVTVKDAAESAMAAAYAKASGDGLYPANARQIMYAARPTIQEMTGQALSDTYFTQTLLPDYIAAHPEQTANWDVVYDARGHLWEPHTDHEVGLGTLGVREYLRSIRDNGIGGSDVLRVPELPSRFPTLGPRHRFGAILYVEKEGFLPLLRQAQFAERYDMAIMSSKGMGTTAVRTLVEELCGEVKILVLHDFDKSGLSILGTLTRDTRRYKYARDPQVLDLGVRIGDVREWNLQSEEVHHKADPLENLQLNGATEEEVTFLRGDRWNLFKGQRVELNAFTSEQFVQWLEAKLIEHKVEKVVPDPATVEHAYRRAVSLRKYRAILEKAIDEVGADVSKIRIPEDLSERVKAEIARSPLESWDRAVEVLARREDLDR